MNHHSKEIQHFPEQCKVFCSKQSRFSLIFVFFQSKSYFRRKQLQSNRNSTKVVTGDLPISREQGQALLWVYHGERRGNLPACLRAGHLETRATNWSVNCGSTWPGALKCQVQRPPEWGTEEHKARVLLRLQLPNCNRHNSLNNSSVLHCSLEPTVNETYSITETEISVTVKLPWV